MRNKGKLRTFPDFVTIKAHKPGALDLIICH